MPQFDFTKPMTFLNALEQFALPLHCVMVALRNEASLQDPPEQAVIDAAHALSSMLEDCCSETRDLTNRLECRLLDLQ